jgi:DNA polymerase III subunit beta
MKIPRQQLLNLITPLSSAVSKLTLGHFHLAADGSTLTVRAMNESMQLTISEPCAEKFTACPDYAALKLALSGLTGSDADLKLEADRLTVTARGKRTIRSLPPKDFPKMKAVTGELTVFDGDTLNAALTFVRGAASADSARSHICGVHVSGGNLVATNGASMRLQRVTETLPVATIPSATVATLLRLLEPGAHSIQSDGKRLSFVIGNTLLNSTLIEQQYPPFERVIPDGQGRKMILSADESVRAVNAVAAFADGKTKQIYISMSGDNVTLSCDTAEEPLDVVSWEGGDHKVSVDAAALADMLTAFGDEDVTVTFRDGAVEPLLFEDKKGRIGVLMPMRF